ncbi:hypothetical protein QVD17_39239 [Tagetes erecta]|uniref:Uncharacterized protein n=1 Tax=Tagetes erecta TaxID=13708 RepID=A0AAD8JN75_TARER|nr:hypothetical protein QVD17_39239 [Tagetes erecta]
MAPNIYCCGAGTAADTEALTMQVPLDVDVDTKRALLGDGNYYYDMSYLVPYSTYQNLPPENEADGNESYSTISSESDSNAVVTKVSETLEDQRSVMRMLDLYSGCGAMSTGLCLGANMADVKLVTLNHPETEARNESAEDFLLLLCQSFSLIGGGDPMSVEKDEAEIAEDDEEDDDDAGLDEEIFEVEKVLSFKGLSLIVKMFIRSSLKKKMKKKKG